MAYRITYEWQKERKLLAQNKRPAGIVLGLLLTGAALALRLLVPQSEDVFRALVHPLTDETAVAAFGELVEQIGGGTSLDTAVEVFCREILEHGQ